MVGLRADGPDLAEVGRISHPGTEPECGQIRPMPTPAAPPTTVVDPGGSTSSAAAPPMTSLWCPPVTPTISRSLVVGDALYTLSQEGLKGSGLADLGDRSWLPFA